MPTDESSAARCDLALARAVLYRFASRCFRHPGPAWCADWDSFCAGIEQAARFCRDEDGASPGLQSAVSGLTRFRPDEKETGAEHARVFGHTPRAAAMPYETEWSGAAGDLLQFHQIADVSAFYRAFALDLAGDADERPDHVGVELEFLQFLCVKEAWAEEQGRAELAACCRETACKFLSQHVATWVPGLCTRMAAASEGAFYGAVSRFVRAWIDDECRRLGAQPAGTYGAPSATSFSPEDACISCGHSASCLSELRGTSRHGDDPLLA